MQVLADLAGLGLERAELLEAEGRRAHGEAKLKRAAEAMSGSLELDDVYRSVVEHAALVTGARKALLTRVNGRARELRPAASIDFSGAMGRRFDVDAGVLGQVARGRRAMIWGSDPDTWNERVGSSMHAPLELGPRLYGVLSVAHEEPGRFAEPELDLLMKLARSSAAAIANAADFQRERRIARALTLGFVPELLPDVAGYETGLLYAPAANEPTGGDVYGAWELPGGEVAVLVGDVAGKGVETAALSAMVRFFIEARSWDSARPSRVLEQANSMLLSRLPRDTFVTAFLGLLSPGRLTYCNAGHLPPLHVSGGDARHAAGPRAAARNRREPRLWRGRAAPGARRPRLRVHRRADRGAPRRRDVRRRAPDQARRGAREGAPPGRARAGGARGGRLVVGRPERRLRGARPAPPPLTATPSA